MKYIFVDYYPHVKYYDPNDDDIIYLSPVTVKFIF